MSITLDRRHFIGLTVGAGATVAVGVGLSRGNGPASSTTPTTAATGSTGSTGSSTTTTLPATPSSFVGLQFGGRRLVVVQLNGGNDLLNTLPPTSGRYHDQRPTLALADSDMVSLSGVDDAGLHSSLAPLVDLWDAGQLAFVRGIGFEKPNRSHFVSMDRWWRADQLNEPGWLGRVVDRLVAEPTPLFGTALGASAPVLSGAVRQPTVIGSAGSFRWVDINPDWIAELGSEFLRTVQAVDEFAEITGGEATSDELPGREGGATIAEGLSIASQLLASDAGAQLVVVSASGFDTHANQLPVHANLLSDVADGVVAFMAAMESAGLADDVLLVVTSEFGRRVAENGSGGCDHGAGGLSLAIGAGVKGGMYGDVDLDDLLEGDIRPSIAPQALFTNCLDWLGVDAAATLGARDDSLSLMRN
jgi:uncharacterized protein (DUF1501 family)